MSPGLLVSWSLSLLVTSPWPPVPGHSFLFSFSQCFLFDVPYHLCLPHGIRYTHCPHCGDFI